MSKYPYPPTDESVNQPTLTEYQERTVDGQETGRSFLYLKTEDRIKWFRRYCASHDILGCIDTEIVRERKPEPSGGYSEAFKCRVYMNGELVATGHGSEKSVDLDPKIRLIETAETYAVGRALKHAGFILDSEPSDKADGDGQTGFIEAPIWNSQSAQQPNNNAGTPGSVQQAPVQASPAPTPAPQLPAATPPTMTVTDPIVLEAMSKDPPASLKEAYAVKFPMRNQHYGKTLGELNATAGWYVAWIAGTNPEKPFKSADRFPRLVAAAKMIVNNM